MLKQLFKKKHTQVKILSSLQNKSLQTISQNLGINEFYQQRLDGLHGHDSQEDVQRLYFRNQ